MTRTARRVEFEGHQGFLLAGIIESPVVTPRGFMLFSHCFTCNKDLKAIVRISRGLADRGWGVLRYDFAGLGNSQGDFRSTNFSTNQEDLRAAHRFLLDSGHPVDFLIGHSFGGAASMSLADELEVRGVVTIAAPSDTQHLASLLASMDAAIELTGQGSVTIGGRTYTVDKQMIDDFRSHDLPAIVRRMSTPLLALHSPVDETVNFRHAKLNCGFENDSQQHMHDSPPKNRSLVCIPGANHLLTTHENDCPFVMEMIDTWCRSLVR
jgi:uncharacterized protein